jgi:Flp pilus assembly protein TadG
MSIRPFLRRLRRDERGSTAIEYGLVLPILVASILGALWVGLLTYASNNLNLAVQTAARCMAVDVNNCGSPSATQTYAQDHYNGPDISPIFTADTSGCGHTVSAQATFNLSIVPGVGSVPLSTSACYP